MKPVKEIYGKIPKRSTWSGFFQNFPGAYFKCCGDTCAVYSYGIQPTRVDEEDVPYYGTCPKCSNKS